MPSRRAVLRGLGAGVVGGVGVASIASPVAAFRDARPDHVTIAYDQEAVERYRPVAVNPPRKRSDEHPQQWHAWIASSPEYDYDVYCYWMFYRVQRGATQKDSHRYDREPVYVLVDPTLEEVRELVYTSGHWMAAVEESPPLYDGQHVQLRIVSPHNHYVQTDAAGTFYTVEPLGTEDGEPFHPSDTEQTTFEDWLDTGWRESLHPPAALDPAVMRSRESWWAEGKETRFRRLYTNIQLGLAQLGVGNPRIVGPFVDSDLS